MRNKIKSIGITVFLFTLLGSSFVWADATSAPSAQGLANSYSESVSANSLAESSTYFYDPYAYHNTRNNIKATDTTAEQDLYNAILAALLAVDDGMILPDNTDSEILFDTYGRVLDDHPEIFYASSISCSYHSCHFYYLYPRDQIQPMQITLSEKVDSIIQTTITPDSASWEKELSIHDYLVSHTTYDYDNYLNGTIPDIDYTAYGILVNGTGVCTGYAKSMKLLLSRLGIDCLYVVGSAGGGHAWNLVNIDGCWYHLDVTWDDPVPDTGRIYYDYFNLSDSTMKEDHTWENSLYPAATSDRFEKMGIIEPTTATFDKKYSAQADVCVAMKLFGKTNGLSTVSNGTELLNYSTDWVKVWGENKIAINKSYLSKQPLGTTVLTFNFDSGATQTLTIMVCDLTQIGDVNDDSSVDGFDALNILLYEAQLTALISDQVKLSLEKSSTVADVNGDGEINGFDALDLVCYEAQLWDRMSVLSRQNLGV